jgi:hypothetical protein
VKASVASRPGPLSTADHANLRALVKQRQAAADVVWFDAAASVDAHNACSRRLLEAGVETDGRRASRVAEDVDTVEAVPSGRLMSHEHRCVDRASIY